MVEIAPQTYDKLEKLFNAQDPQSTRGALVTEKGGVYSSHSLVGRFLQLVGVAKPVQVQDLENFFNNKLHSLHMGRPPTWTPTANREDAGRSRLSGEAFQQFKLNTLEPHNVRMRKTFNDSIAKVKTLTESLDAHVTQYQKLSHRGKNPVMAERSIRRLSESLDREVENLFKASKGILGKSEERPEIPSKLLFDATVARWVTSEILDYRDDRMDRAFYPDNFERDGRPLPNAADFERAKVHEAAQEIMDSCEREAAEQAKVEDREERARWKEQQKRNQQDSGDGGFDWGWQRHASGAGASSGPKFHNSQSAGGKPSEFNQKITTAMQTLGLDPAKTDYTERDIKMAYKKAALASHPDKIVQERMHEGMTNDTKADMVKLESHSPMQAVNDARDVLLGVAEWYFRGQ